MTNLPGIWEEPFKAMTDLGRLFDRLDMGNSLRTGYGFADIYEKDGHLHFEIELPGLSKNDISARIEDNCLIISGEIKRDEKINQDNYFRMERRYGRFQKSYLLPDEAEKIKNVKARYEDGILKVAIPLKKSMHGETIDIKIE